MFGLKEHRAKIKTTRKINSHRLEQFIKFKKKKTIASLTGFFNYILPLIIGIYQLT